MIGHDIKTVADLKTLLATLPDNMRVGRANWMGDLVPFDNAEIRVLTMPGEKCLSLLDDDFDGDDFLD